MPSILFSLGLGSVLILLDTETTPKSITVHNVTEIATVVVYNKFFATKVLNHNQTQGTVYKAIMMTK